MPGIKGRLVRWLAGDVLPDYLTVNVGLLLM
jgi:hypothetical protein